MNKIVQLLQHYGPSLSSDIAAILRQEGKSPEAARQFVSRLPEGVHVLHGLPFPKRARFMYLEKQFPTDRYWNALTTAIDKANPAYSAAIAGVRSRGGCVRLRDFDVVSGSPVKQKGQVSGSTVLQRLCSVDLMSTTEIDGLGECVLLGGEIIDSASLGRLRARLLTENVLLDAIRSWAGKMNLASPNTTRIRDDNPAPQFATCRFDLCGPCYLRPVRRQFLPMLIADGFTPEALRECRSSGIITTKPDTLFGQDVARALGDLLQTLSNAAAIAAANPDRIEELFRRLSTVEGSAGNLRGALFELVVGHMVRSIEGGSIDIGTLVRSPKSGQCAEIDVRLVKERQVFIYECKGYQPSAVVQKDEIEEWLTKRIPVIQSAHRAENRFSDSAFRYEFWTSGTFHADAAHLLHTARAATTRYQIDWKDGAAVSAYAKQIKAPGIRKILDEHYFKHPLANIPQLAEVTEDLATPGIN